MDTRTSPGSSAAMVRKTVPAGGKKYVYYVCAAHKNEKTCYQLLKCHNNDYFCIFIKNQLVKFPYWW